MATVEQTIDQLVLKARKAADIMKHYTQEQVDRITAAMDAARVANEIKLAEAPATLPLSTPMMRKLSTCLPWKFPPTGFC
jgi:hypothetical protein